jgi:3-oxoacyl-[acyl-carrier protein] reductase
MDLGLHNKSVIVTAGSKGLGFATALEFAREGAKVTLASRDLDSIEAAKNQIINETGNASVDSQVCDMRKESDIKALVQHVVQKNGTVDVLVNNTGGPKAGKFEDLSDSDWKDAYELNLLSFIRMIREVLPFMKQQKSGHIVNFASSSIKEPIEQLLLSNTFRTGIVGLSKSLSQEFAPYNILINTLGPGRIDTDRVKHLDQILAETHSVDVARIQEEQKARIPLGRYGKPEEFAKAAVFLCSPANGYITGQAFLVDGGMVKAI